MAINKSASAVWKGDLKTGRGTVSTESGALANQPYGFNTRFEGKAGTNPEELLGAAHASCFSMALSMILGKDNLTPDSIETTAKVTLEEVEGGFGITAIHLTTVARIPGADQARFDDAAKKAKEGCPVSKVLNAKITLDAKLA